MPSRRGRLRRPLLGLRRAHPLDACAALGLEPWHDPTNSPAPHDPPGAGAAPPRRSVVRHRVLPVLEDALGPGVAVALARTADALREDADALDVLAGEVLAAARVAGAGTGAAGPGPARPEIVLDVAVLAAAPAALRRRALRRAAVDAGTSPGALHRTHVLALDALVTAWRGQGPTHLPGGVVGERACGRLRLHTPHD